MLLKPFITLFFLFGSLTGFIFFAPDNWLVDISTDKASYKDLWLTGESKQMICPDTVPENWRESQVIEQVEISASALCEPDNPYEVAAFVRGTNNISMSTLMKTKLSADAVTKTNDRDGDGDPDEIHIRLEIVELNGLSADGQTLTTQYAIGPGIKPGFWVYAPKSRGMSTTNESSQQAHSLFRMPSPAIRVEQGDTIKVTLENTHYLPHSIHLHGVDHPFKDANGEGNDGVPMISESMLLPGESRTYDLTPRHAGTMFYHCHVQPQSHILMGLNGLFIVEENRKNNWLQTFNVGAGQVRHSSVAIKEQFDREYDLHYQDVDSKLGAIIQQHNDAAAIAKNMNRIYKVNQRRPDYFLLNGKSFPYTLRDALVVVAPDEKIKLRVLNGGSTGVSLHLHGHKTTTTHLDGVELPKNGKITRDVVWLSSAQRADLILDTTNDGLHSYGSGAWLMHDHGETGVTSNGLNPGGDVSMVVYEEYLNELGIPKTHGDLSRFFDPDYYLGKLPVFMFLQEAHNKQDNGAEVVSAATKSNLSSLLAVLFLGLFIGSIIQIVSLLQSLIKRD